MRITQTFYDHLAPHYDKLFLDWETDVGGQAALLDGLFAGEGYDRSARILDCACGIGTQAIGLAALGYAVSASDLSCGALNQARKRAAERKLTIDFREADFRALPECFFRQFDIVIAMGNALPHMLTHSDLKTAVQSIMGCVAPGGLLVASIRDYDALLLTKPSYSPPYIHQTAQGQRVSFQTWQWAGETYQLIQYIIEDGEFLQTHKFVCEYRATRREELSALLSACGCSSVSWRFPADTGFYQPIVIARKEQL